MVKQEKKLSKRIKQQSGYFTGKINLASYRRKKTEFVFAGIRRHSQAAAFTSICDYELYLCAIDDKPGYVLNRSFHLPSDVVANGFHLDITDTKRYNEYTFS